MSTSEKSTLPIDLILVTWGRQTLTDLTIRSIKKNTKKGSYRLIVIDNCSDPEMMIWLLEQQQKGNIHHLELNDKNYGLEYARNQGLALAKSKYVVCIDNDCLAPPKEDNKDWLQHLVSLMEKYPEYAAIALRTHIMIGTGNIIDGHEDEDIVDFPHPGGSYRIMLTQAVRDAGGWRDDNPGRGQEERYICGKLHDIGWKTAFSVKRECLHLFGDQNTDRWGYPKEWNPEDTGHSDIYHPALEAGDDPDEIRKYVGNYDD